MVILKYDLKTNSCKEHTVPSDWKIATYCDDMDEIVNCVSCGSELKFGFGYSSRRYYSKGGFGYCECENCYFSYHQ